MVEQGPFPIGAIAQSLPNVNLHETLLEILYLTNHTREPHQNIGLNLRLDDPHCAESHAAFLILVFMLRFRYARARLFLPSQRSSMKFNDLSTNNLWMSDGEDNEDE